VQARIQVKRRTPAYAYAYGWRVGRQLKLVGARDFSILVDLGAESEMPTYWIVTTVKAAEFDRQRTDQDEHRRGVRG